MEIQNKIDFQNVEELKQMLRAQKIMRDRFSLEITERECANGIYAAMCAEVELRRHELILDEYTKRYILQAAQWLVDADEKCGLLLTGLYGNGKTTLMKAIARLIAYTTEEVKGYSRRIVPAILTAKSIALMCADETTRKDYRSLADAPVLCIDEIGEEPTEVISYGMVFTPIIDLLLRRYENQRLTLMTSNLTPQQITKKYGARVGDRLKEIVKKIIFDNASYRK